MNSPNKPYDYDKTIGTLHDIDGDVFHVSISPDGQYVLVSSRAIPTSLFKLSSGTLVQEFPFTTSDGDMGYGVFDKDGYIYFNTLNSVAKYKIPSIE